MGKGLCLRHCENPQSTLLPPSSLYLLSASSPLWPDLAQRRLATTVAWLCRLRPDLAQHAATRPIPPHRRANSGGWFTTSVDCGQTSAQRAATRPNLRRVLLFWTCSVVLVSFLICQLNLGLDEGSSIENELIICLSKSCASVIRELCCLAVFLILELIMYHVASPWYYFCA